MTSTEALYFTRRAGEQIDRAAQAHDPEIARVHWQLSDLYLSRAHEAVEHEVRGGAAGPRIRLPA